MSPDNPIPKSRQLTLRQKLFVEHYFANPAGGATKAVIAAGYAPRSARTRAYKLMHSEGVREAIGTRIREWRPMFEESLARTLLCAYRTLDPNTAATMTRECAKAAKVVIDVVKLGMTAGQFDFKKQPPDLEGLSLEARRRACLEELNLLDELLADRQGDVPAEDRDAPAHAAPAIPPTIDDVVAPAPAACENGEAATPESTDEPHEEPPSLPPDTRAAPARRFREEIPLAFRSKYPRPSPGQDLSKTRIGNWARNIPPWGAGFGTSPRPKRRGNGS